MRSPWEIGCPYTSDSYPNFLICQNNLEGA